MLQLINKEALNLYKQFNEFNQDIKKLKNEDFLVYINYPRFYVLSQINPFFHFGTLNLNRDWDGDMEFFYDPLLFFQIYKNFKNKVDNITTSNKSLNIGYKEEFYNPTIDMTRDIVIKDDQLPKKTTVENFINSETSMTIFKTKLDIRSNLFQPKNLIFDYLIEPDLYDTIIKDKEIKIFTLDVLNKTFTYNDSVSFLETDMENKCCLMFSPNYFPNSKNLKGVNIGLYQINELKFINIKMIKKNYELNSVSLIVN